MGDMSREDFIASMISLLATRPEDMPGDAAAAAKSLSFDMPQPNAADVEALADAVEASLSTGGTALPEFVSPTPKFLAGVRYTALQPGSRHGARLCALLCVKLVRRLLESEGDVVELLDSSFSHDHLVGLTAEDWASLAMLDDVVAVAAHMLQHPSPNSAHWTRFLFILRDRAVAAPIASAAAVVPAVASLYDTEDAGASEVDTAVSQFVNRAVMSALLDIAENAAAIKLLTVRRAVTDGMAAMLPSFGRQLSEFAAPAKSMATGPVGGGTEDADSAASQTARDRDLTCGMIVRLLKVYCEWGGPTAVSRLIDAGVLRGLVATVALLPPSGAAAATPLATPPLDGLLYCVQGDAAAAQFASRVPGMMELVSTPGGTLESLHPVAAVVLPLMFAAAMSLPSSKASPADVERLLGVALTRLDASLQAHLSASAAALAVLGGASDAEVPSGEGGLERSSTSPHRALASVHDTASVVAAALESLSAGRRVLAAWPAGTSRLAAALAPLYSHLRARGLDTLLAPGAADSPPPDMVPISMEFVRAGAGSSTPTAGASAQATDAGTEETKTESKASEEVTAQAAVDESAKDSRSRERCLATLRGLRLAAKRVQDVHSGSGKSD